jgi:acetyltransferase-like isoleucine patch superfamily enzyme
MLTDFLKGLRMLRHAQLVRRLGDIWRHECEIEELRRQNPGAKISSDAAIEGWPNGTIRLAPGSQIELGTVIGLGDARNGYGSLDVGERTWIGPYNNFRLAGGTRIEVGADCLIAQFCTLVGANHSISRSVKMIEAPPDPARTGVRIGDDVWLGAGVTVLPGLSIGSGAVVGAGSVITHSIGAYEIWAGNPARKIGERPA